MIKGGKYVLRCLTQLFCSTFCTGRIWVCLWQFSMVCNGKWDLTQHHSQDSTFAVKWVLHLFWLASFSSLFCRLWAADGLITLVATTILAPLDLSILSSSLKANHLAGFVRWQGFQVTFWLRWAFVSEQHFRQFLFFLSFKTGTGLPNSAHVPLFHLLFTNWSLKSHLNIQSTL